MTWLLGLVGATGLFAVGVAVGWHIPMPPWAKWAFNKIGWKTAA